MLAVSECVVYLIYPLSHSTCRNCGLQERKMGIFFSINYLFVMLCLFVVGTNKFKLNECTCTVIVSAHSDAGALLTIWIENQFSLQITVLNNITERFKTETINSIVHVYLSIHCVSKLRLLFAVICSCCYRCSFQMQRKFTRIRKLRKCCSLIFA